MIRKLVDRAYRRSRKLDSGFDPDVAVTDLIGLIVEKGVQRFRGVARGLPGVYLGRSVRIRGRRRLSVGTGVSLGKGVVLEARSRSGISLGDSVTVDENALLRASGVLRNLGEGIVVGDRTAIGWNNFIHGGGGVLIGQDCLLGPSVSIFSENHRVDDVSTPIRNQGEVRSQVILGDDVWVGSGATILSGVTIGSGAVVAAGSVVTKDVLPRSIVAGVPAKQIGSRGHS